MAGSVFRDIVSAREYCRNNLTVRPASGRTKDLSGVTFGKVTVIEYCGSIETNYGWSRRYICHCNCGNYKILTRDSINSPRVSSCGCVRKECASSLNSNTEEYFLNKLKEVNPHYSLMGVYSKTSDTLDFNCSSCGDNFSSRGVNALQGKRSCSCSPNRKIPLEEKFNRLSRLGLFPLSFDDTTKKFNILCRPCNQTYQGGYKNLIQGMRHNRCCRGDVYKRDWIVYLLGDRNSDLVKVGITSNLKDRVRHISKGDKLLDLYVIYTSPTGDYQSIFDKERDILGNLSDMNHPLEGVNGGTEFFKCHPLEAYREIREVFND